MIDALKLKAGTLLVPFLLELVSKILLRVKKADPQGLKPQLLAALGGTAEAVPFPKPIFETTSSTLIKSVVL
ncbi:MAG: hypothetical protein LAO22_04880 [Acidobacteriia bacterium]|nr:hypothetical protein [Terriglobia bacterium]